MLTQSRAISRLGGIGKTQIALEYAYRHMQDDVAIFCISAANRESLQSCLGAMAERATAARKKRARSYANDRAVKEWLASHQNWLLILDHVDDVTSIGDVLPHTNQDTLSSPHVLKH